jgi:hypothetical protein
MVAAAGRLLFRQPEPPHRKVGAVNEVMPSS